MLSVLKADEQEPAGERKRDDALSEGLSECYEETRTDPEGVQAQEILPLLACAQTLISLNMTAGVGTCSHQ